MKTRNKTKPEQVSPTSRVRNEYEFVRDTEARAAHSEAKVALEHIESGRLALASILLASASTRLLKAADAQSKI